MSVSPSVSKRELPPSYLSATAVCEADYAEYLGILRNLISRRTVVTDDRDLQLMVEYLGHRFAAALTPMGWRVACDGAGNLRCVPPVMDVCKPVLWLNAHADTVNACAADFAGRDPFTCFESTTHLIGRGANDCKAGVAFMLWYAERLALGRLPPFNGGFLVTRREEAGSSLPRTASQFAADMVSGELPLSAPPERTYVWFLENTVSLASHLQAAVPEVAVYDCERHSLSLLCHGSLAALGLALLGLEDHEEWKTVAAWPCAPTRRRMEASDVLAARGLSAASLVVRSCEGGHSCPAALPFASRPVPPSSCIGARAGGRPLLHGGQPRERRLPQRRARGGARKLARPARGAPARRAASVGGRDGGRGKWTGWR